MTRLAYIDEGTTAGGGGGGQQGGDTVFLGPDYGEPVDLTVGAGVALQALTLGPFSSPQVGTAATLGLAQLGPFNTPQVGARASWSLMSLGPFATPKVGAAVSGRVLVTDLRPNEDSWFDQANQTTVHGAATELQTKNNVLNDQRVAVFAWDFTGYAGTTAVGNGTFHCFARHDGVLGAKGVSAQWRTHTSKPFEEDTASYSTAIPMPNTTNAPWPAGFAATTTYSQQTVTCSQSVLQNAINNGWLYAYLFGLPGVADTETIFLRSKEHSVAAEQPRLTFTVSL